MPYAPETRQPHAGVADRRSKTHLPPLKRYHPSASLRQRPGAQHTQYLYQVPYLYSVRYDRHAIETCRKLLAYRWSVLVGRFLLEASISLAPMPSNAIAELSGGLYTGLSVFLDGAAFATVVFGPAGLPLDVGIQHVLCVYCSDPFCLALAV